MRVIFQSISTKIRKEKQKTNKIHQQYTHITKQNVPETVFPKSALDLSVDEQILSKCI